MTGSFRRDLTRRLRAHERHSEDGLQLNAIWWPLRSTSSVVDSIVRGSQDLQWCSVESAGRCQNAPVGPTLKPTKTAQWATAFRLFATLSHILGAEWIWLERWQGRCTTTKSQKKLGWPAESGGGIIAEVTYYEVCAGLSGVGKAFWRRRARKPLM